ncbi:MAG: DUF6261 family protein [Prolixibacteraceae bacterium]
MLDIAFSKLTNEKLFALSLRVKELISPLVFSELGIELYANAFMNSHEKYSESMSKGHVSSDTVGQRDSDRDDLSKGFVLNVRSYTYFPDQAKKDAAKALLKVIDQVGRGFYRESYDVQTAKMENLFIQIDENHTDKISLLGLTEWYSFLKGAESNFISTLLQYTSDKADLATIEAATKNRASLIDSMRKLFTFLPMQAEISDSEVLQKLIAQLDEELSRF